MNISRLGALNLFAAFNTRTGKVWGQTYERKRQVEFIQFLEYLDKQIPPHISQIHIVLDNLRMHKAKQVQAWLAIASSLYLPLSPGALLLDESGRTVVWHSATACGYGLLISKISKRLRSGYKPLSRSGMKLLIRSTGRTSQ